MDAAKFHITKSYVISFEIVSFSVTMSVICSAYLYLFTWLEKSSPLSGEESKYVMPNDENSVFFHLYQQDNWDKEAVAHVSTIRAYLNVTQW